MELKEFWSIIDEARREAGGDGEGTGEVICELLSERDPDDIRDFAGHLNNRMRETFTVAMLEASSLLFGFDGEASADAFEYFRAWLITRGQRTYEAVLANPDELATIKITDPIEECSAESLLAAPEEAYEGVTGIEEGEADLVELDITRGQPGGRRTGPVEEVREVWQETRTLRGRVGRWANCGPRGHKLDLSRL